MGRTAPLTSKRCILCIYSTNIGTEYFKHALYSPFFSSSKCSLFHNANLFGSCIIHILYTGCAEIKKNNSGAKGLNILIFLFSRVQLQQPNYYPHSFHHVLLNMFGYAHLFWVHEPLFWYLLQLGRQQGSTFIIWAIFGYARHHIANLRMIHIKVEIFCQFSPLFCVKQC